MKHEETLTATLQAQRDSEKKMMIQNYMIHREQQNQNL